MNMLEIKQNEFRGGYLNFFHCFVKKIMFSGAFNYCNVAREARNLEDNVEKLDNVQNKKGIVSIILHQNTVKIRLES